jgi:hypothetical protein
LDEKRKRRIEKQVEAGIIRFMLKRGIILAACMALVYAAIYLLHRVGWLNSSIPDTERIIVSIVALFLAGCLTNFFAWDRLIEQHKQNAEEKDKASESRMQNKEKVS